MIVLTAWAAFSLALIAGTGLALAVGFAFDKLAGN